MVDLDVLLPAIRSGEPAAFARWMAGAEPTMRDSLRSFAAVVDVEAVLQEALLRTWQIAPRVELDGKSNSLLRVGIRIARNLAVSERRRARGVPSDDDAIALSPTSAVARRTPPIPIPSFGKRSPSVRAPFRRSRPARLGPASIARGHETTTRSPR